MPIDDRWITLFEVAEYLHVSHDVIYRLAQRGKIPASKVGGRWRFKKEKIDQWMDNQQDSGHSQPSIRKGSSHPFGVEGR